MNSMIGKSTGIALLMAAALLAALFAMGVFSATGVKADVSKVNVALSDYTPGATGVTMTVTFNSTATNIGGTIDFTVNSVATDFDFPVIDSQDPPVPNSEVGYDATTLLTFDGASIKRNRVNVSGAILGGLAADDTTVTFTMPQDTTTPSPVDGIADTDTFEIIIKGITNPANAGIYDVIVNDGGSAVTEQVRLASVSSQEPGAAVQIVVNGDIAAGSEVIQGNEIEVDLAGFSVPSTIAERSILLGTTVPTNTTSYRGNPESVVVTGTKVRLSIPTVRADGTTQPNDVDSDYTITFKQSAGITNPATAGHKKITLTENAPSTTKDTLWVTINRVVKVDKSSGTRGTMVTVTGKGFGSGTSTVYLQGVHTTTSATAAVTAAAAEDPPRTISVDAGDPTGDPIQLGSASTTDGTFTVEIDTTSPDFKVGTWLRGAASTITGVNRIQATDATGAETDVTAYFQVKGKVAVAPDSVAKAGTLTITVTDWTAGVTRVSIGGVEDCDTSADATGIQRCFLDASGDISQTPNLVTTGNKHVFKVKVPTTVPLGTQQVAIRGDSGLVAGTGDVTVSAQELSVSPTTAARGEVVSISGSGFTPNGNASSEEIMSITVGGVRVPASDNVSNIDVVSGGNVNFNITIPRESTLLRNGENTIVVTAWNGGVGTAKVNIPKASITLSPDASRRGTTVNVEGGGFFAGELVLVEYVGTSTRRVGSDLADSTGSISLSFDVPSVAEIGKAQKVRATSEISGGQKITAEATHTTPEAMITISPSSAAPGSRVTITGTDFPLYTAVTALTIDGVPVLPVPTPVTKGDGSFTADVIVPQAELGERTVLATVSNTTQTTFITIGDEPVVVLTDPADVFAPLVDAGRLARVWYQDRATQDWTFYDPDPAFASFNRLNEVSSGQVVTIIITDGEPIPFQGETLYQGSNSIALD